MDEQTRTQLTAIHRKLVELHPDWPSGKADWIARRMLELG